jgi:hypothetical protein
MTKNGSVRRGKNGGRTEAHNWDVVGLLDGCEWLLVDAKAHLGEFVTSCTAINGEGREKIERAGAITRDALNASGADWLNSYYQMENRLAFLYFLSQHRIAARLYFTGRITSGTNARGLR